MFGYKLTKITEGKQKQKEKEVIPQPGPEVNPYLLLKERVTKLEMQLDAIKAYMIDEVPDQQTGKMKPKLTRGGKRIAQEWTAGMPYDFPTVSSE